MRLALCYHSELNVYRVVNQCLKSRPKWIQEAMARPVIAKNNVLGKHDQATTNQHNKQLDDPNSLTLQYLIVPWYHT